MTQRLSDAIHDNIALTTGAVRQVARLSDMLHAVGLEKIADQLDDAVAGLIDSAKAISDAHIDDVNGQIDHGRNMIGGLLMATLNGNIVPSGSTNKTRA